MFGHERLTMRASKSKLWGRFENPIPVTDCTDFSFMALPAFGRGTNRQIFTASSLTVLSIIQVYQASNLPVKSAVAMLGIDYGDNGKGYVWSLTQSETEQGRLSSWAGKCVCCRR